MILDYLRGILSESSLTKVTLEVSGIGYRLFIPLGTYEKLPHLGKEVRLYVTDIQREDSHTLYGFLERSERDFFETLNEVSGIGPKLALSILGHLPLADFFLAISQGNGKLISTIPGIGKKMAERLILELRDKVKTGTATFHPSGTASDAISALMTLGYTPLNAQKAVKAVLGHENREISLPELITLALKIPNPI